MTEDKQTDFFGKMETRSNNESSQLEAKFIIPPFSVLDTRQGYWQKRKNLWAELGIKSEIGRNNNLAYEQSHLNKITG